MANKLTAEAYRDLKSAEKKAQQIEDAWEIREQELTATGYQGLTEEQAWNIFHDFLSEFSDIVPKYKADAAMKAEIAEYKESQRELVNNEADDGFSGAFERYAAAHFLLNTARAQRRMDTENNHVRRISKGPKRLYKQRREGREHVVETFSQMWQRAIHDDEEIAFGTDSKGVDYVLTPDGELLVNPQIKHAKPHQADPLAYVGTVIPERFMPLFANPETKYGAGYVPPIRMSKRTGMLSDKKPEQVILRSQRHTRYFYVTLRTYARLQKVIEDIVYGARTPEQYELKGEFAKLRYGEAIFDIFAVAVENRAKAREEVDGKAYIDVRSKNAARQEAFDSAIENTLHYAEAIFDTLGEEKVKKKNPSLPRARDGRLVGKYPHNGTPHHHNGNPMPATTQNGLEYRIASAPDVAPRRGPISGYAVVNF